MTAPINFQDPVEILFKHIEDGVRYGNACMQPETDNTIHQSTKLVLISGADLQDPKGNSTLSQAQKAVQVITLPMLQNTMTTTSFLLTAVL
jgi:hypothetical protein